MRERGRVGGLLGALDQRVAAAAQALGRPPGTDTAGTLCALVALARRSEKSDVAWLVLAAVLGTLPVAGEVQSFRRVLETRSDDEAAAALLADVVRRPWRGELELEMDVVVGGVVVNVDFCARHDIHTGIHRVVRETLPRWARDHEHVATANVDSYGALRTLAPRELQRVFDYAGDSRPDPAAEGAYQPRLVVPWRGVLVIPEIPDPRFGPALASLAELSGNAVTLIGYDMIPVVSADLRPHVDAVRFGHYLTVVKHAARVAGISVSATTEFAGFAHAVTAQGLPGPEVLEVVLPADVPPPAPAKAKAAGRPRVLCVGSHEPHKNHRTVLYAAERLWREGLDFELEFIGGPGWQSESFVAHLADVVASGRPLVDRGRVSDEELWQAYRDARFTVFLSVHEGFGLPVVESLACGTPVVTTDFGSMAEIAEDGGCRTVDPLDDDAVTEAMRRLLVDDDEVRRLRQEALRRPVRTWDDYAADLWDVLATVGSRS
ncbi:glycosyltransferase family 1 protein [Cellulomonas sp. URHE0023]|uniref:glycosyltransferase family 4 protein n=1 Tax=Cellulomonas sp. URHE0023 TaxID=1380354 RepID=UPI0004898290|nr:glycosyltransferase family 1 protein [Cellulomonas sp. URHE0023]